MQLGAEVILYDGNTKLEKEKILRKLSEGCMAKAEVLLGELMPEVLEQLDLMVISPGVPTDLPVIDRIRDRKIPIWGEIELAYVFGRGDVLAITGTNGKTTTTALLGEIMRNAGRNTFVVGNIGNPYTDIVFKTKKDSVIVAEMSSFQLETIHTFRPDVYKRQVLALVAWIGYSAYDIYDSNKERTVAQINYDAVNTYLSGLAETESTAE